MKNAGTMVRKWHMARIDEVFNERVLSGKSEFGARRQIFSNPSVGDVTHEEVGGIHKGRVVKLWDDLG
eukprot:752303-Hanusia_phi.AAC.6